MYICTYVYIYTHTHAYVHVAQCAVQATDFCGMVRGFAKKLGVRIVQAMELLNESRGAAVIDPDSDEGCALSDFENAVEVEDVIGVEEVTIERKRRRRVVANMDHQESVLAHLDGALPDDPVEPFSPPRLAPAAQGVGFGQNSALTSRVVKTCVCLRSCGGAFFRGVGKGAAQRQRLTLLRAGFTARSVGCSTFASSRL